MVYRIIMDLLSLTKPKEGLLMVDSQRNLILRRKTDFYLGWTLTIFAVVGISISFFLPRKYDQDLAGQAVLLAIASVMYPGWLATAHPKVIIDHASVTVVNWLTKEVIPWHCIEKIRADAELTLELTSGREIKCTIGAQSFASALVGDRLQRRMAEQIESFRPEQSDETAEVRKRLDIYFWQFATLWLILLGVGWIALKVTYG
jgi:hypothetical protein